MKTLTIIRSALLPALLLAALALLPACSYSTKPLYRTSIKTVAVPVWGNKTFRTDWEMRLTEALDKNIEIRTPYKLAPRGQADTILTGQIVRIDEFVLTRRYGLNLPQETQLVVVVDFTWKDLRSGQILVQRKEFARTATDIPQIGERVEDAEQWAIERVAAAVVDQMQSDW